MVVIAWQILRKRKLKKGFRMAKFIPGAGGYFYDSFYRLQLLQDM